MTSRQELIKQTEESSLRDDPLEFAIGDTVDVHSRILEGDKERIQVFTGVVIARRGGGTRETFTVRRIVAGEGVERTFPVHSPKIALVEVKRHGRTRRAKLFYLRDRVGKKTRLAERRRQAAKAQVPGTQETVTDEEIAQDMPPPAEDQAEGAEEATDEGTGEATEKGNE